MAYAEQRDIEAKYWLDYNSGVEGGKILAKQGVSYRHIKTSADCAMELIPGDVAYWTGVKHGAKAHRGGAWKRIKRQLKLLTKERM